MPSHSLDLFMGEVITHNELPSVRDVKPDEAGVNPIVAKVSDGLYFNRGVEARIRSCLNQNNRVLVIGDAMTGKTQTLLHVIKQLYPSWGFFKPSPPDAVNQITDLKIVPANTVIWLDNLADYPQPELVAALNSRVQSKQCVVVASLDSTTANRALTDSDIKDPISSLAYWFHDCCTTLSWSGAEQHALAKISPKLASATKKDLPQYLAGGQQLSEFFFEEANEDEEKILTIFANWHFLGMRRALKTDQLLEIAPDYFGRDDSVASRIETALANLTDTQEFAITPLVAQEDSYCISKVLAELAIDSDNISESLWLLALGAASPVEATSLGLVAYQHDQENIAYQAWLKAATADEGTAMTNLGIFMSQNDDHGAEQWWQQAIAKGNTIAMAQLGTALFNRNDISGAVYWLSQAVADGWPQTRYQLSCR